MPSLTRWLSKLVCFSTLLDSNVSKGRILLKYRKELHYDRAFFDIKNVCVYSQGNILELAQETIVKVKYQGTLALS
jgi:hypothetical protein